MLEKTVVGAVHGPVQPGGVKPPDLPGQGFHNNLPGAAPDLAVDIQEIRNKLLGLADEDQVQIGGQGLGIEGGGQASGQNERVPFPPQAGPVGDSGQPEEGQDVEVIVLKGE